MAELFSLSRLVHFHWLIVSIEWKMQTVRPMTEILVYRGLLPPDAVFRAKNRQIGAVAWAESSTGDAWRA